MTGPGGTTSIPSPTVTTTTAASPAAGSTVADPTVLPAAAVLLACLEAELSMTATPPRSVSMRVGATVELLLSSSRDECCEGVGWVRVVAIYPSTTFPVPDDQYTACAPIQWAAVLEMGVARCALTPGANTIPTADEWNTIAATVLDDAAAMRRALCCYADEDPDRMWIAGTWQPLPVEGGCLGGTQTVTVAVPACDCD